MSTPYTMYTPEQIADMKAKAQAHGIDPRRVRPDGSVEADNSVPPERMREFLAAVNAIPAPERGAEPTMLTSAELAAADLERRMDEAQEIRVLEGDTGTISAEKRPAEAVPRVAAAAPAQAASTPKKPPSPFDADEPAQKAIFAKVARFLDPRLKSPVQLFEVRYKLFVMRIPSQQEMIDVLAFTGQKVSEKEVTVAEDMLAVVGECLKACDGWLPAKSAGAQLLRAHINDPELWPKLRPLDWLASRDKSSVVREAYPLYQKYMEWRSSVEPTADEIDFYYSRLG